MPPKKADAPRRSDVSTARFVVADSPEVPATAAGTAADSSALAPESVTTSGDKKDRESTSKDALTIEDLSLPKSIITRLAKGVLPPNTQIQANAILALSKSATVFINYIASAAEEHTADAGRKTILPPDVFKALEDTEFAFLRGPLEAEVAKFNNTQATKRTAYRKKVQAAKKAAAGTEAADSSTLSAQGGEDTELGDVSVPTSAPADGSAPKAKKARLDPAGGEAEEEHDADETEPEDEVVEDEEDVEDEPEAEDEEEEDEEEDEDEGNETQDADALERHPGIDQDEALDDADDSD